MTGEERNEAIRRNAEYKAAVVAYVNSVPMPLSAREINSALKEKIEELGVPEESASKLIRDLGEAGIIGMDTSTRFFTFWGKNVQAEAVNKAFPIGEDVNADPGVKKARAVARQATTPHPTVQLDVVKGTGRVRLTLEGLTIEIGVVDK